MRDEHLDRHGDHGVSRKAWFRCACCPPNVMRLLASLQHYFASGDADGIQLHQYATGSYEAVAGAVRVETGYPWSGGIAVTVERGGEWTLSLRVPGWCADVEAGVNGVAVDIAAAADTTLPDGWLRIRRAWQPGDVVSLNLAMPIRLTAADPRVDAVRGCAAIERGPLVYCLEEGDQPQPGLDAFVLDPSAALTVDHDPDLLDGVTVVRGLSRRRTVPQPAWWPYHSGAGPTPPTALTDPLPFTAIPYYAWANRQDGAMRIWLPMA